VEVAVAPAVYGREHAEAAAAPRAQVRLASQPELMQRRRQEKQRRQPREPAQKPRGAATTT
jgi:hypothetical protein